MEIGVLLAAGVVAGLTAAAPDFHLRIPGHAILRSIFPMALGMALVPRRLGGVVMACSALGTAFLLNGFGVAGLGAGAITSLSLTGPLLDAAVWRARAGWRLYLCFVVAGLASNLVALLVRAGAGGGRPAEFWWQQAVITYPLCGIVAGLVSAAVWFQLRERQPEQQQ
jgi:hypothetical protein